MHWDPRGILARRAYSLVYTTYLHVEASKRKVERGGRGGTRVVFPKEIKLTEVMHTEFSWIVSCLSWVYASSYFPRETEMAKGAGKCEKAESSVPKSTANIAIPRISRIFWESERATGGFLFQFTARYIIRKAWTMDGGCVRFSRTQPRNPRALTRETAHRW